MRIIPLLLLLAGPAAVAADQPARAVFAEDFENFNRKTWDEYGQDPSAVEIVEGGRGGKGKCVRITATRGKNTGAHLYKMLDPGLDTCHLRFYVKFEADHPYVHHFVHLTGYNPPTRYPQGGAGERPKGHERFSTGVEPWGFWGKYPPPGAWNLYSYWCEMKASRDGRYWGNSFAPDPPVRVERGKWVCVEVMLKCNSAPDKADGEQALWIDGKEVGRWGGIRWRTDPKLKVNGVWMLYYLTDTAVRQNNVKDPKQVSRVWFDDIVVAETYVGPVKEAGRPPSRP